MASPDEERLKIQEEILANLKEEARRRAEISSSIENYVETINDIKEIQKTILEVDKKINVEQQKLNALKAQGSGASAEELEAQENLVAALEKQNKELKESKKLLGDIVKSIDRGQLALAKSGQLLARTLKGLPSLIESGYAQLRGYGLFDMDKAIKKTALSMGVAGERAGFLRSSIKSAADNTVMFGAGIEELAQYQADYSEELGRSVMLGQKGMEAIAEMAKGTTLGADGAAKMAADFEQQGYSAERTRDLIKDTVDKSAKMGLNSSKVIKNMQANMKLLNKYSFKGGVKGLQKMAETTSKLGIDMNSVAGMADKLFDIEGAVDMSAQLQVLGGSWAQLADPFKLMYMARNDMAGLTEEIGRAAASTATFNSETGEFDISAMELHRLRKVAEATGMSYEDLATAAKNAAKFSKLKTQISFKYNKEAKEFLENTAQLDEKGRGYVEMIVDGKSTRRYLNELDDIQLKGLMGESKSLKERAEQAMTFDDTLKALSDRFKMALLPFVEELGKPGGLADSLRDFVKKATDDGWFEKISNFAKRIAEFVTNVGKFILPIVDFLGPGGTLATWAALKAATWVANGFALAKGFMFGTKGLANVGGGVNNGAGSLLNLTKGNLLKAGGLGLAGSVVGMGTDYLVENQRKKGNKKTADFLNVGGSAASGALTGAALGSLVPIIGTTIGAIAGGLIGGGMALYKNSQTEPQNDALFTPPIHDGLISKTTKKLGKDFSKGRSILQGGKVTPIDNKDDLLALKKGGAIDNVINNTSNKPNIVKHEFGELTINGKLEINTPGNKSAAVDLLKDQAFVKEITDKIKKQIEENINGVAKKGK